MRRPRVLMVTGVYDPETSGASLQCRQLIRSLRDEAQFEVLTTSAHRELPAHDEVDAISVTRINVDPSQPGTKGGALLSMTSAFARLATRTDIVHFHGFSQKNMVLTPLARATDAKIVMKLTSVGHDDALTMKASGGLRYRIYRSVDRAIAVSPRLQQTWCEAGLDPARVTMIPNSVDTDRFRPAGKDERDAIRARLGWDRGLPAVLFVGFFSHEKRPDVLYRAWARLWDEGIRSSLVFIGATQSRYHEIDPVIAARVRADAGERPLAQHLHFIERTEEIEQCYRAADVFALPTTREGLPNVLLEAMASGIPAVISRLPGVTDWIVDDGVNGCLVSVTDEAEIAGALQRLLTSPATRQRLGDAARARVEQRFAPRATAERTLSVYRELIDAREGTK